MTTIREYYRQQLGTDPIPGGDDPPEMWAEAVARWDEFPIDSEIGLMAVGLIAHAVLFIDHLHLDDPDLDRARMEIARGITGTIETWMWG